MLAEPKEARVIASIPFAAEIQMAEVKPDIAIITPYFNRPELLARLHESLLRQDGGLRWLHIIVDDFSTTLSSLHRTSESARLKFIRLSQNSGPLVARNVGLEYARASGASYICFVDDDDYLIDSAFATLERTLKTYPDEKFLMFRGMQADAVVITNWPSEATRVSWIVDIVANQSFGSDNFVVLSMDIVRDARFSEFGWSQREWTFFAKLARRWDRVLICPESLRIHRYLEDGLTKSLNRSATTLSQAWNIISRAMVYYSLKPTNLKLGYRLVRQLTFLPLRLSVIIKNKIIQQMR